MESGWRTLQELLPRGAYFASLEGARLKLAEYLARYRNTQRLHSALHYCPPLAVEFHYLFNLPDFRIYRLPATLLALL